METAYGNINHPLQRFCLVCTSIGVLKDQVLDELTKINDSYVDITENFFGFSQTTNVLIEEMQNFVNEQKNLHDLWKSYKHSFDALNSEINDGITTYSNTVNQSLNDVFQQYDSSVSKVLGSFKSTLDEFNEKIEELQEVLEQYIGSEIT